jgi:hypothetical protein
MDNPFYLIPLIIGGVFVYFTSGCVVSAVILRQRADRVHDEPVLVIVFWPIVVAFLLLVYSLVMPMIWFHEQLEKLVER